MSSIALFRHAMDQWEIRAPTDQYQLAALTSELQSHCGAGINLYIVDLEPDDPWYFRSTTLVGQVDLKGDQSQMNSYPDRDYVLRDVIPFYLDVKNNNAVSLRRMTSTIQAHYAVYDRLLLPVKEHKKTRWAISMTKTRVLIPPQPNLSVLSEREQDILYLLSEGFSSKEIAQRFTTSYRTVENQIANIKAKLAVKNVTQAVAVFVGQTITQSRLNPIQDKA